MVFRLSIILSALCIASYLGYHSIHGQRGYYAWQQRKAQAATLQAEYVQLSLKKEMLLGKVKLMRDKIDVDLLEQYAWTTFQMISPKKKVFIYR